MFLRTFVICFGLLYMVSTIDGHGALYEPPSRVSAWRFNGETTPRENTDTQWNCGGFKNQWLTINKGKCGVCGDPWNQTQPRESEPGGKFAKKVTIVRTYSMGQIIDVNVLLTANHWGYFEFKLCTVINPLVPVTQKCLDKTVLQIIGESGYKFDVRYFPSWGEIKLQLQLPENFACEHCVLQWRYRGGNNNNLCEDGISRYGCGNQEEFRACADIKIINNDGVTHPIVPTTTTKKAPIVTTTTTTTKGGNGPIPEGGCSSSSTGFLRDTKDCSRFYQCVPTMGGGWNKVPMSCGSGTVFNQVIPGCDWAYNVPGC